MAGLSWKDVPVPARMQKLDRDARGYPIPFNILRDSEGKPHFTINDHGKAETCINERRCPICGDLHGRVLWFAGGPMSAFHPAGCYIDQPMHKECVHYAMKVCPYLAAPRYTGRIDAGTLDPEKLPNGMTTKDPTMIARRPDVFVLVGARTYSLSKNATPFLHLHPQQRVGYEFWRKGVQISFEDAQVYVPELQVAAR